MSLNGNFGLGFTLTANTRGFTGPIRDAGHALSQMQHQANGAGNAMGGVFRGADGRLRDARGKFVSSGQKAGSAWSSGFMKSVGLGGGGKGGSDLFGKLAGYLTGGAVLAGFTGVIGAANEFTVALHQVKAISGATAGQMKQLEAASIKAGIATQFSPTEAANALSDLASAGYNVQDSMTLLVPTLDLAAASLGQLSPSDAAGLASQTLKAFKLNADQAAPTVDKLVQSMNLFAIQAKDLPLGIAGVSRGATAMNQSLDESLIAFGLVRNILPRVESASMAVSTAMERMVDPKVQQKLHGIGAEVQDSAGKFRPFLDVVGDMLPKLQDMTDAKRAAFLQDTFGAEALGGFNAIMGQVTKGIQTSTGETLKGAAAIGYLRDQFAHANGTAARFRDEMLKDLPGQLTLLKGSLQTLAIEIGKPMANALAPLTKGVLGGINTIIEGFNALPDRTKAGIAKVVMLIGLLGTAFLFAGGPVALLVGAVVAGAFAIKTAIDNNLGGIGDKFHAGVAKARLVWDAFVQLFSQGGFSGAVRKEMGSAENGGVRNFVIGVWTWLNRLKSLFAGVGQGFSEGLVAAQPAFDAFGASLDKLLEAFGLTSKNDPTANVSKWQTFGNVGAKVGTMIATGLDMIVSGITHAMDFVTGFTSTFEGLGSTWDTVKSAGDQLKDSLNQILASLGLDTLSSSKMTWEGFGKVIGRVVNDQLSKARDVISVVANVVNGLAHAMRGASEMARGLFKVLRGDSSGFSDIWHGMKQTFFGVLKAMLTALGGFVTKFADAIDTIAKMGHVESHAGAAARSFLKDMNAGFDDELADKNRARQGVTTVTSGADLIRTQNALAVGSMNALGMAGGGAPGLSAFSMLAQQTAGNRTSIPTLIAQAGPTHVNVFVDSEQVAARAEVRRQENVQRSGGELSVPND